MFGEPLSDQAEEFLEHTFAFLARSKGNVFAALTADEPAPDSPERAHVDALRVAFASRARRSYRPGDDIATVAALLKSFFRRLPEPLLTFALHGTFIAAVSAGHGYDDVRRALRALPDAHARVLARLTEFLGHVASLHPEPDSGRRSLGAAFAGLLSRDPSPTLEGVLADAAFIVELLALLMRERSLFEGTAGNEAEDAAFKERMQNSYKRLRVNMAAAYQRERAVLRKEHSEAEVSKMMQRRADKVRTGTLDSTAMAMFERLVGAEQGKIDSVIGGTNEEDDDEDDDAEIQVEESSSSSVYEEVSSGSEGEEDGANATPLAESDYGVVPSNVDRDVRSDLPRRTQSARSPAVPRHRSSAPRSPSALKFSAQMTAKAVAMAIGDESQKRRASVPINEGIAHTASEWSDEDSEEEVVVTKLTKVKKDKPPASPGLLAAHASAKAKEKKDKLKAARDKRSKKSSSKSKTKKKAKIRKKEVSAKKESSNSASPSKRRAQRVRIIASHSTATPGKLSYEAGDEALIVQKMSSTWAKARIGDRIGLIRLADVEEIDDGNEDEEIGEEGDEQLDVAAINASRNRSASGSDSASPLAKVLVADGSSPKVAVRNRSRSGSGAFDQYAIATATYDAATHERAKKDYLRRRARSSGRGLDELAARANSDSVLGAPLFFEAGARIHLLSAPADRPWWQGELDGKIGCFQASAVRHEDTGAASSSDESSTPLPPPPGDEAGAVPEPDRAQSAPTLPDVGVAAVGDDEKASRRSYTKERPSLKATADSAVSQSSPALAPLHPGRRAPTPPQGNRSLSQSARPARQRSQNSPALKGTSSVPSSPRGGESSTDASETAPPYEILHGHTASLIAAVEALVTKLPDAAITDAQTEFDGVALALRKAQQFIATNAPSDVAESDKARYAASAPTTPQRQPLTASRAPPTAPAATSEFRRRNPDAGEVARKLKMGEGGSGSGGGGGGLQIGKPQVVPASPKLLRESPSRTRRSASVAMGGGGVMVGGDPKKATRIGSFLSKFSSKGNEAPVAKVRPTFGVPLRKLVESAIDIPEFVLRGGERLAKCALQEDVLLLGNVDEERVALLRDMIEAGERIDYTEFGAHDITATLQQFIQELPEPLIGRLSECAQCAQIDDEEYRDALFQSLLAVHKPWHRALLEFLLVLQHRFAKGFATNTLENFVNVFAAAMWQVSTPGKLNEARKLLRYMCEHREALFGGGAGERLLDNDNGVPIVSAATKDRLIIRLLDANYAAVDPTFANVFFLTHDYVIPPSELADRLMASYARCQPGASAENNTTKHVDLWRTVVCSRVLLMLHFWLTNAAASHLHADLALLRKIGDFARPIREHAMATYFDEDTQSALAYLVELGKAPPEAAAGKSQGSKLKKKKKNKKGEGSQSESGDPTETTTAVAAPAANLKLCQRCNLAVGELKLATGRWTEPLCRPCGGAMHEVMSLKMQFLPAANWAVFSTKDIADTVTQIDFTMLRAIRPQELLHKAFADPKRSPNFAAMTTSFNRYSQWVATEILKCDKANQRAECIVRVLKVAQQLRRCYNFHAFFAFVSGLSFSSVTRLHRTWAKVPKKYREKFEQFQQSMSMDGNFGAYQKEVSEALADGYTIIPLLVLLSKRLTAVEENNPTYLADDETKSDDAKLVNCSKLRMLYKQIDEVLSNQTEIHNDVVGQGISELRLFFLNLKVMEEADLHKISLAVEARSKH